MADIYEDLPVVLHDTTDATPEGDIELVEEMAATTVLYEQFTHFINNLGGWFGNLKYTSEQGNAVRTHIAIVSTEEDIITEAHNLRDHLIELLAKRGDEATETGSNLRKQVIEEN